MAVPYTFATATSAIPLSQLDSNFATAITIGSTATYLGNTTTTIAGLTLTSPTLTTPALGTPSSGVLTNCTGYPSSAISGTISLTTQVTGTLPVANGGTGVTTSTGTGNVVLSTTPTLVTPILGTPTSGTLTNTTGFPAANLAGTALPAAIVTSSLTALGTIATGTWNGSIITGTYGGTGVNNGSNTITIAGNLTHAGAFTQSFTATANTAVTLPAGATASANNLLSSATAVAIVTGTPSSTTYLRGDGTWATIAAGVSLSAANTWTATQTFNGSSSTFATTLLDANETVNVVASAPSATTNFYIQSGGVQYYTSNAANNWTLNIAFSSGTSLNTALSTGQSVTFTLVTTQGSTAYYNNAVTIDGTSVTPKWIGGAPTAGNASGLDVYRFAVVKTASATYTVLASLTQYK